LAVGHARESVESYFGNGRKLGVSIQYAVDWPLLGTAGAVRNALPLLHGDAVLILNGDSFIDIDYAGLIQFQEARGRTPGAALAVTKVDDAKDFGTVLVEAGEQVSAFVEKGRTGPGWVNVGIYVVPVSWLSEIPPGTPVSLEKEWFPSLIIARRPIWAYRCSAYFIDFGTSDRLEKFSHEFPYN